jgi:hypothetical protein
MEAELKKVIADHWTTATKLGLVQPEPHVTVEMKDERAARASSTSSPGAIATSRTTRRRRSWPSGRT